MTEDAPPPADDCVAPPRPAAEAGDFVRGLSRREEAEIRRALGTGESVLWAARPQLSFWEFSSANDMVVALLGSAVLLGMMLLGLSDSASLCPDDPMPWLVTLLFLPFWCILFWRMSAPWRRLWRLRRTLYVITNRRALLSEPKLFGWQMQSWPLREGMILQRRVDSERHGSLVFSRETIYPIFSRACIEEFGFLCLADVERAEQALRAALSGSSKAP